MAPSHDKGPLRQSTLDGTLLQRGATTSQPGDNHRVSKSSQSTNKPKAGALSKSAGSAIDTKRSDVLLAIKPVHLGNIVSRQKNHEYRKYRLHDEVVRLWLYETRDGGSGRSSITYVSLASPTPCLGPHCIFHY